MQANLVTKTDFDSGVSSVDSKIAASKIKNESIENELKKLKIFDSSYFRGKSYIEENDTQNYLVSQTLNKYCLLFKPFQPSQRWSNTKKLFV